MSGGVSLGAYQAGYLYYATRAAGRIPDAPPLRLVTGASAGSLNALMTALAVCGPPVDDPEASMFWQAWIDIGYRELFDPDKTTAISIMSREPLIRMAQRLKEVWRQGLFDNCDMVMGITATRLETAPISIHDDLQVPHQEEKFGLRIRGRGLGRPPRVTNYFDPSYHLPQPMLPLDETSDDDAPLTANFDRVRDLLFASAAFPIAFPPQRLEYCLTKPVRAGGEQASAPQPRPSCPRAERADDFIDGGVFDNNPLGLAVRLAALGRVPPGRIRYVYLDPDSTAYPMARAPMSSFKPLPVLPTVARLAGAFVSTSRGKELFTLAQNNPTLPGQMQLTKRYFPTASGQLLNFLGFFEREFRRYDFYLGMYDAYKFFETSAERRGREAPLPWPAGTAATEIPASWRPFACLLGLFDSNRQSLVAACAGESMRDFRILAQLSIDRLYVHCSQEAARATGEQKTSHEHCARAASGAEPPRVPDVRPIEGGEWRRKSDESDLDHVMRLLAEYRFEFHDLGLERDESAFGRVRLRRKVLKMLNTLADRQPSVGDTLLLKTAGRTVANSIEYEPPRSWAYIVAGSYAELGLSTLFVDWNRSWARLNVALEFDGLGAIISDSDSGVSVTPALGPELELLFLTNQWLQPTIGARAGYRFNSRDDLGSAECTATRARGDARRCTGLMLEGYLGIGIYERARVQVVAHYLVPSRSFDDRHWSIDLGIGFQFF